MHVQTIYKPIVGPKGHPYCVQYRLNGQLLREWYWTAEDAMNRRDECFDLGYRDIQVLGLPTTAAGG